MITITNKERRKFEKLQQSYVNSLNNVQAVFESTFDELVYITKNYRWILDRSIEKFKFQVDEKIMIFGGGNVAFISSDLIGYIPMNEDFGAKSWSTTDADRKLTKQSGEQIVNFANGVYDTLSDPEFWSNLWGAITHSASLISDGISSVLSGNAKASTYILFFAGFSELFALVVGFLPDSVLTALGTAFVPLTGGASIIISEIAILFGKVASVVAAIAFVVGGVTQITQYLKTNVPQAQVHESQRLNESSNLNELDAGLNHLILGIFSMTIGLLIGTISKSVSASIGNTIGKYIIKAGNILSKIDDKTSPYIETFSNSLAKTLSHSISHGTDHYILAQSSYVGSHVSYYIVGIFTFFFGNNFNVNEAETSTISSNLVSILGNIRKFIDNIKKSIIGGLVGFQKGINKIEINVPLVGDFTEDKLKNVCTSVVSTVTKATTFIFNNTKDLINCIEFLILSIPIMLSILPKIGLKPDTQILNASVIAAQKDETSKEQSKIGDKVKGRINKKTLQHLGNITFDSNKARKSNDGKYLIVKDTKTGKDFGVIRNQDGTYQFKPANEKYSSNLRYNYSTKNNKPFKLYEEFCQMNNYKEESLNEQFSDWSSKAKKAIKLAFVNICMVGMEKIGRTLGKISKEDMTELMVKSVEALEGHLSTKELEMYNKNKDEIIADIRSGKLTSYPQIRKAMKIKFGFDL